MNVGFRGGKYQLLPFLLQSSRYFFVYGGGGAWCHAYDFGSKIVKFIARFTKAYIVLPSTYELCLDNPKGTLFRRDEGRSKEVAPESLFCHDMAFYLALRPCPIRAREGTSGNLFRTDRESSRTGALPADNVDVSRLGDHMSNGDDFLRKVAEYGKINTDRLHVAIAGALVGAKVQLSPGNYFKIREIYNSSMAATFQDRVSFVSDEQLSSKFQNVLENIAAR